jgi:hypothetical protein
VVNDACLMKDFRSVKHTRWHLLVLGIFCTLLATGLAEETFTLFKLNQVQGPDKILVSVNELPYQPLLSSGTFVIAARTVNSSSLWIASGTISPSNGQGRWTSGNAVNELYNRHPFNSSGPYSYLTTGTLTGTGTLSTQAALASNATHPAYALISDGSLRSLSLSSGSVTSGTLYFYNYPTDDGRRQRQAVLTQLIGVGQATSGVEDRSASTREERAAGQAGAAGAATVMGAGISAEYGRFKLNGVSGTNYGLPLATSFDITDRVGLNLGLPLIYSEIGDATAYGVGVSVGLPVRVFQPKEQTGLFWQLTPTFGGTGVTSKELETGGVIINGGISSLASYDFGPVAVSVGNHISTYESTDTKFGGYRYETGVSQRVIKNGLKVDVPIGQRWVVDVYAVHNKLTGSEVLDNYMTYGADLAFRVIGDQKKAKDGIGQLSVGFRTDQGTGYRATNIQFGSGWKF